MYLFALFLVLYEFTTYSANDMIMPGMLSVVKYFNASEYYVADALSFYILGNCVFLLLAGFLAERFGKRIVILGGNFLFLLFTIIIIFSLNIHQFMLWRFFQGAGLGIIAIGYALIHENFSDKEAIKLAALMANVSLLAPLLGPALGSIIMSFFSWQYIFVLSAIFGTLTLIGLFRFTPKDKLPKSTMTVLAITKKYGLIIKNKEFFLGMLSSAFIVMPLLIWISQAPNLILYKLKLNYSHYVIYQLISISGLTVSSIFMQFIVGKFRLYSIVKIGAAFVLSGMLIILFGSNYIELISVGMFIYAFGMSLANGCIWRLVMTIKGHSHAMLAAMLGCLQEIVFVGGIIAANVFISRYQFSLWVFALALSIFGFIGFLLVTKYISAYKNRDWL